MSQNYAGGTIGSYTNGTVVIVFPRVIAENKTQSQGNSAANNFTGNEYTGQGSVLLPLYTDWRLPTRDETDAICSNIRNDISTQFPSSSNSSLLWTSTNCGGICYRAFAFGTGTCSSGGVPSSSTYDVVVVRVSQ